MKLRERRVDAESFVIAYKTYGSYNGVCAALGITRAAAQAWVSRLNRKGMKLKPATDLVCGGTRRLDIEALNALYEA